MKTEQETKVRIKLKGQFYGKIGTIVKRQNQYLFGIKFEGIQGVHPFSHRNIEVVDCGTVETVAKVENEALASMETRINQCLVTLYALANQAAGYPTQFAKGSVHAYQTAIKAIEQLKNPNV